MARKILLADDSVTAQNMGRKILTDAGYEVVTVNNGSAALKKILELKPDLIVLDVYMPGYSGLEVCLRVKENKDTGRIPVLLTVGKLEPFKPEEARRARADAFVVKPFEASELLAALTRLEDKIVPQAEPYKQGRFAKAVAAVDPAADAAEKDESWKARLRIPSGPPKPKDPEPPEVEYAATQGKEFRDFDTESSKKQKSRGVAQQSPFAAKRGFERPVPAGVPVDITPEEIAAIAAAAEQLKGKGAPAPAAEPAEAPPPALPEAAVQTQEPVADEAAPVTFASAPEVSNSEVPSDSHSDLENAAVEFATEAQAGGTASEAAEAVSDLPSPTEPSPTEPSRTEPSPTEAAPAASEPVEVAVAEPTETQPVVTPEVPSTDQPTAAAAPTEVLAAPDGTASETAPPAVTLTAPEETVAASVPIVDSAPADPISAPPTPGATPADDEVMAALQSLMPTPGNNTVSSVAGTGAARHLEAPAAIAAIVGEVDSTALKARSAVGRWIAEEVALAPDEATLSLEREMEQAYAAVAASNTAHASVAAPIATSVEAPAELPARESAPSPEAPAPAVPSLEAPAAFAMAAAAGDTAALVGTAAPIEESVVSPIEDSEQHRDVEVAAAVAEEAPSAVSADAPATVDTQIAGGAEDMVANWKNIRDSIASGAPKAAPAKEKEEVRPVEPEKVEAAAPPVAVAEVPAPSASDPRSIASIVDSVLAELRPKIVEEIAKKLADSKKD